MDSTPPIPRAFIWRRLHSLAGLWLVLYLINHLFVNSQAALLFGNDGRGFIHSVNSIHELPYLPLIEIFVLGVPIVIHALWGIQYLRTGQSNSLATDGSKPGLPQYSRNKAYTWQRITSWILALGILAHVVQMRFIESPVQAFRGDQKYYMVKVALDEGLPTVAERLGVLLITSHEVQSFSESMPPEQEMKYPSLQQQHQKQREDWVIALKKFSLNEKQVIAIAKDFGTAELLMVRNTFQLPVMMVLYTLFVLAACYHAFNGLWTCLITWGIILTQTSQRFMLKASHVLMVIVAFLGLAAIWGTYWINLKS